MREVGGNQLVKQEEEKMVSAVIVRHFLGCAFIKQEKMGKCLRNISLKPATVSSILDNLPRFIV